MSQLNVTTEGTTILGVPVGQPGFVHNVTLKKLHQWSRRLLHRLASAEDLSRQAKMLILRQCISFKPAFLARTLHLNEPPGSRFSSDLFESRSSTALLFRFWDANVLSLVRYIAGGMKASDGVPTLSHLPIKLGGLGIRMQGAQADMAFTASLTAANYIYARIQGHPTLLSRYTKQRIQHWWNAAETWGPAITQEHLTVEQSSYLVGVPHLDLDPPSISWQRQLQTLLDGRFDPHFSSLEELTRREFLQEDVAAPTAWLTVLPSKQAFNIPDDEFATLLAARLLHAPGHDLPVAAPCPLCHKPHMHSLSHIYKCRQLSQWCKLRHDRIVDIVAAFAPPHTQIEAILQPVTRHSVVPPPPAAAIDVDDDDDDDTIDVANNTNSSLFDGNNNSYNINNFNNNIIKSHNGLRMDLVIPVPSKRARIAVDVTVVAAQKKAPTTQRVFDLALSRKRQTYTRTLATSAISQLIAFSINPFGSLSPDACKFIDRLIPDPLIRADCRTRISVSVARGTARMIQCWSRRAYAFIANHQLDS